MGVGIVKWGLSKIHYFQSIDSKYDFNTLITTVSYAFMAVPCHGENHPDPKSGLEVDPDKLGSITFCQGDETDPIFLRS